MDALIAVMHDGQVVLSRQLTASEAHNANLILAQVGRNIVPIKMRYHDPRTFLVRDHGHALKLAAEYQKAAQEGKYPSDSWKIGR